MGRWPVTAPWATVMPSRVTGGMKGMRRNTAEVKEEASQLGRRTQNAQNETTHMRGSLFSILRNPVLSAKPSRRPDGQLFWTLDVPRRKSAIKNSGSVKWPHGLPLWAHIPTLALTGIQSHTVNTSETLWLAYTPELKLPLFLPLVATTVRNVFLQFHLLVQSGTECTSPE